MHYRHKCDQQMDFLRLFFSQHPTSERAPVPLSVHHMPLCVTFAFFCGGCVCVCSVIHFWATISLSLPLSLSLCHTFFLVRSLSFSLSLPILLTLSLCAIISSSSYLPLSLYMYNTVLLLRLLYLLSFPSSSLSEYLLVDPGFEEEQVMDGRLTVAMNVHREICALQMAGGVALHPDQVLLGVWMTYFYVQSMHTLSPLKNGVDK